MKKQIALIVGSFLFSLLFYRNDFGLNIVLFSAVVLLMLGLLKPLEFRKRTNLALAGFYLLTSLLYFVHSSSLALVAMYASFFLLLGSISQTQSSVYVKLMNGFFSTIAGAFYNYYNREEDQKQEREKRKIDYLYWVKMIGIPLIAVTTFVILYRSANPIFDDLVNQIDLSFINFQWLFFTGFGYLLLLNMIDPSTIEPLTEFDSDTPNYLNKNSIPKQSIKELVQENQLGIVLMLILNLLILFYLVTDLIFLNSIDIASASTLSKAVHEGVYALITSIVFAIFIIVYFFRGNLNYFTKNHTLKTLSNAWIVCNIVLVVLTSYKNFLYCTHFGLTYKRVGVFIYLILAVAGLISTFIKVNKKQNLWYQLRFNVRVAFAVLIVSSFFNWDALITRFNLEQARVTDMEYLIQLKNNSHQLKVYADNESFSMSSRNRRLINEKFDDLNRELAERKWQELTFHHIMSQE